MERKCVRCGNMYMQVNGNHAIDGFKTYALINGDYDDSPRMDLCPECASALMAWMKKETSPAFWDEKMPGDRRIQSDVPTAIFIDACGTTKDHEHYNMIRDSVTKKLSDAAGTTIRVLNLDAAVYAATDEVTFLFPDARRLMHSLNMMEGAYEDYVMSTFLQYFAKNMRPVYPAMRFKCRLFYIRKGDMGKYIESRREICHRVVEVYYAKEYLDSSAYHQKTPEEVRAVLEENGIKIDETLYNGILTQYEHKSMFEITLKTNAVTE